MQQFHTAPCPFKNKTLDSAIAYSTTIYIEKKTKKTANRATDFARIVHMEK
jgi:hypothetical protein